MAIASVNPATGEILRSFDALDARQIESKLATAERGFAIHRRTTLAERARQMNAAADLLAAEENSLARIITLEMGKLMSASVDEVQKCARGCRYYAEHAETLLSDQPITSVARRSFIRYQPMGVVLAIMPWNFPFWQVFRFAAPTLMAGNVGLLKHAANVPQCALAIEDIFRRAGFAEGSFQTLLIETEATKGVIEDARVKAVTLTGSDRAGSEVASAAARHIKKSVLELGGSDPFIVMPSAQLTAAIDVGVKARTINTGQSCIAAKRFIVADAVFDEYLAQFVGRMRSLKLGDPMDRTTQIGPIASEQILQCVDAQVKASTAAGAKLLIGGKRVERPGFYYEPTVLTDIPHDSPAAREEIFGPVAAFFRVRNAEEAVAIANDSVFGLGASAWTNEAAEQDLFAAELDCGMVFINAMVASDPRLPFGGIKRSGFGRELGAEGIREFVNVKTVVIP
ncbi:MAG: NAD-dependent succinate-semialdehyde dehydrogenase [Chthoniobacterales bacterium]|jgi:succinate-semialdehyde dehydrogenase/glutarate-semialdehyde dehydrogenase|nr:NAD-dependent succinate-semialdehyde dehydrogenase [Chthoniobacterales bacterium]MBA3762279.1 NAD-dependent succinate-semialdehyde dehydrogenase [Chthoniobacterales bacterium]